MKSFDAIKKDFPLFKRKIDGKRIVYLDSSATSLKPQSVIDAVNSFYTMYTANVFRGIYKISEEATAAYEKGRELTANFIHASSPRDVVLTRNTSESLNLIAYSWFDREMVKGDEVVTTIMEHHSNFVPWQQKAAEKCARFKIWYCNQAGILDLNDLEKLITKKTKLLTVTAVSNVLGTINPISKIVKEVKRINPKCLVVVDAAQAVPHMPVDVEAWGADVVAFSGHKMLGPSGIGGLWAKKEILEDMKPFLYGGDMIREVHEKNTLFNDVPHKFEAGTPYIEGSIGLGAAVQYLSKLGMKNVRTHEKELTSYAFSEMKKLKGLTIYGPPDPEIHAGVVAFRIDGIHPHDVAQLLDRDNICIRVGYHCAMPLHEYMKVNATCRASFYVYTDKRDVDALVVGLEKVIKMFK